MKKYLPYIIGVAVALLIIVIIAVGNRYKKVKHEMDERITLKQSDKIPYGTSVVQALMPGLFPGAKIYYDAKAPAFWEDINASSYNQAVVLMSRNFNADEFELEQLLSFVEKGNYVFIIAKTFSYDAQQAFNFKFSQNGFEEFLSKEDSLMVSLTKPSFSTDSLYVFPGKKYESWFTSVDVDKTIVLGETENGYPNFIQMKRGQGSVFIHAAPLAFSNYFILHKNNTVYFEKAMSVIPKNIDNILWNEYYLNKRIQSPPDYKEPSWLNVLFRYPAFKWGFLTALLALLLYGLLGMRRKQRMIPLHQKPKNESMDFVKTMGRLYYDRKDHYNLAKKMSVYFLEHVRSTYKLPTHTLDDEFLQALHYKTGYPAEALQNIISFITSLQSNTSVNEKKLAGFHKELETFYQNT